MQSESAAPAELERVLVALSVPAFGGVVTYLVPPELREGCVPGRRVQAPLGKRSLTGVVIGPSPIRAIVAVPTVGTPTEKLRPIERLLDDGPLLSPDVLELCRWAAAHYLYPLGPTVKAALPPGIDLRERLSARLSEKGRAMLSVDSREQAQLTVLDEEGAAPQTRAQQGPQREAENAEASRKEARGRTLAMLRKIDRGEEVGSAQLRALARRELVSLAVEESKARVAEPRVEMVEAAPGAAGRIAETSRAPRQKEALDYLLARGRPIPIEELSAAFPAARAALKKLVQRSLAILSSAKPGAHVLPDAPWGTGDHPATPDQARALAALETALDSQRFSPFLLHGVTGSGKTWVYLEAIARARAGGGGALVLVPEIALTPQLAGRFRARFGDDVAVLHSGLTDRERLSEWLRVQSGNAGIVVGARSAVFAPVVDLKIVVVDEEHEASYKQEERLRYHARDLALVRAQRANAVCVLGSATPSLESLRRVHEGKLPLLSMPIRVDDRPLPLATIVDRKVSALRKEGPRLIGPELAVALRETLARGEQSILYLNRRGHARTLLCTACGATVACPNCDVALVLHQAGGAKLVCHFCGHHEPERAECVACGNRELLPLSGGTERLEEELATVIPEGRAARLDRDAAGTSGAAAALLARFAKRELDVMVGTQMVAKGHDFPGVTLVGVLDADGPMSLPDFRAAERCVQLLAQVAGRAGRGDLPGRVILQALKPNDPALISAAHHDWLGFAKDELERRRAQLLPPFSRLCAMLLQGNVESRVRGAAERIAERARSMSLGGTRFDVLGPAPAPLSRLRGKHRYQVLLRASEHAPIREAARSLLQRHDVDGVELVADIDPIALL
jgi:primosomal protein N' (replication factor Y)